MPRLGGNWPAKSLLGFAGAACLTRPGLRVGKPSRPGRQRPLLSLLLLLRTALTASGGGPFRGMWRPLQCHPPGSDATESTAPRCSRTEEAVWPESGSGQNSDVAHHCIRVPPPPRGRHAYQPPPPNLLRLARGWLGTASVAPRAVAPMWGASRHPNFGASGVGQCKRIALAHQRALPDALTSGSGILASPHVGQVSDQGSRTVSLSLKW